MADPHVGPLPGHELREQSDEVSHEAAPAVGLSSQTSTSGASGSTRDTMQGLTSGQQESRQHRPFPASSTEGGAGVDVGLEMSDVDTADAQRERFVDEVPFTVLLCGASRRAFCV